MLTRVRGYHGIKNYPDRIRLTRMAAPFFDPNDYHVDGFSSPAIAPSHKPDELLKYDQLVASIST